MPNTPLAPLISNLTSTGFQIDVDSGDGNPATTHYSFRVVVNAETKYVDGTGQLQDTEVFLNVTTITVLNADPNTAHSVSLSAADDALGTNETTNGPSAGVITLAANPTAKAWTAVFSTTATASWGANGNPDGTGYFFEFSTDPNFLVNVSNSGWITTTGYTITNLSSNTTYYGRVKARNSALVETSYVSLGSVTTLIGPATVKAVRVFNLLAERGFLITWQPNQETDIDSYIISRSSSPTDVSEFEQLGEVSPPITSFIDKQPYTFGLVFYYKVQAKDSNGNLSDPVLSEVAHENTFHSFEEQPFIQNVKQADFVNDEIPTGAIDGVNVLYVTKFAYRPGSVEVFLNGLRMRKDIDYVEGPLSQQITFTDPPDVGGDLRVTYVKF